MNEREELQIRLDAHLRCADRNPRKRSQHIISARYCAEQLGIEIPDFPRRTGKSVLQGCADVGSVHTARREWTCHSCKESILPRAQYFNLCGFRLCMPCAQAPTENYR
jgi:hypothetical protein